MDITHCFVSGREKAKLDGDHDAYRAHLSNRIRNLRKKLGIATKPRAKYSSRSPITIDDIASNHDYVYLLLLTSERAWAKAIAMREIHSTEKRGITGSTRSHIISRLHKAKTYAGHLHQLLAIDRERTGFSAIDVLEAGAYAASLRGALEFEKQGWEVCINNYSEARVIYSSLATKTGSEIFKNLLTDAIDPSIRYGAYQIGLPRTIAVDVIARERFPANPALREEVERLDLMALKDQQAKSQALAGDALLQTINWRSRNVALEDAAIAIALTAVKNSVRELTTTLGSGALTNQKDKASAYDGVLLACQDAVDSSKSALDELISEGVTQGDRRVQALQITKTAITYEMVSWRIGRNRILVGDQDGVPVDGSVARSPGKPVPRNNASTEESAARKLAQLREKCVLYDAILQSLGTIKELPGVAADSELLEELDAQYSYFKALKCFTVARSHEVLSKPEKALALLNLASGLCHHACRYLSSDRKPSDASPPNLSVSSSQAQILERFLRRELQRHRALVELADFTRMKSDDKDSNIALVDTLHEYSINSLNLKHLVSYPPKLEPIPVKPLFFDVAWNYVDYPGRVTANFETKDEVLASPSTGPTQQKRGWFGFSR